ncbi:MAG: dockerin type I domain-containing protein [Candidatus Peribacteraceae bacterium]|nr:dockerin type I domain-containing protein [Candidatus Peribacteraceae bacterium]
MSAAPADVGTPDADNFEIGYGESAEEGRIQTEQSEIASRAKGTADIAAAEGEGEAQNDVDVLVAFDAEAQAAAGGDIRPFVEQLFVKLNAAFENSRVNAEFHTVDYVLASFHSEYVHSLGELISLPPEMYEKFRTDAGADLVLLVTNEPNLQNDTACGIALYPAISHTNTAETDHMFAIRIPCDVSADQSFVHEAGHTLGMGHEYRPGVDVSYLRDACAQAVVGTWTDSSGDVHRYGTVGATSEGIGTGGIRAQNTFSHAGAFGMITDEYGVQHRLNFGDEDHDNSKVMNEFAPTVTLNRTPILPPDTASMTFNIHESSDIPLSGVRPLHAWTVTDAGDSTATVDAATGMLTVTPRLAGTETITVAARDDNGSTHIRTFSFDVTASVSPLHNAGHPTDVDANGEVEPLDALRLVNTINGQLARLVDPNNAIAPPYYDVNNDWQITPADALVVINELNVSMTSAGGEAVLTTAHPQEYVHPGADVSISTAKSANQTSEAIPDPQPAPSIDAIFHESGNGKEAVPEDLGWLEKDLLEELQLKL